MSDLHAFLTEWAKDNEVSFEQASTKFRKKALSQWYTQEPIAELLAARVHAHKPKTVLEPAAGEGNLVVALDPNIRVTAYELDEATHKAALEAITPKIEIRYEDFLKCPRAERFDVGLTNSPFENEQDTRFAYKLFKRCAHVVCLVRVQFAHRAKTDEMFWSSLPDLNLDYYGALVSRPGFGGTYHPMDEYIILEFGHEKKPTVFERIRWKK